MSAGEIRPNDAAPFDRLLTVAIAVTDPALARRIREALRLHPLVRLSAGSADLVVADADPGPDRIALALTPTPSVLPRWQAEIRAVLPDDVRLDRLHDAIDAILAGFAVLPPRLLRALQAGARVSGITAPIDLTARERQVLELLVAGDPNKLIARRLGIAVATAKFHVAAVLDKLGARSRSDAVAIAIRHGLVLL
ncbi:MAG: response regulator transcription factor [Pseudomonadota bacterium]|nr:response regulator transcription factor [Pseudomonadota bacterium]